MKRNQKGFGAVEGLLILILLSILGFTGYYVYHTRNNTNSTYNNAASTSSSAPSSNSNTSLTLEGAVAQTQKVYDEFYTQFGKAGGLTADDFVNAHKSWFTKNFQDYASKPSTSTSHHFLICFGGSALYTGSQTSGDSLSGQTAKVTMIETQHDQPVDIKLPVTLKAQSGAWAIDSIDFSSCDE